jgi:hypothetical protein
MRTLLDRYHALAGAGASQGLLLPSDAPPLDSGSEVQPSGTTLSIPELLVKLDRPGDAGDVVCVLTAQPASRARAEDCLCYFVVADAARAAFQAGSRTIHVTDVSVGWLPRLDETVFLSGAVFHAPRSLRSQRLLDEIREVAAAIDYARDRAGSMRIAESLFDRLEAFTRVDGFACAVAKAEAQKVAWENRRRISLLLFPAGAMDQVESNLSVKNGRLYYGTRTDSAAPWRRSSFMLVDLGREDLGAGGVRALERLRQQHKLATAELSGREPDAREAESYRDRDRRLRKTRDLAARFGSRALQRTPSVAPLSIVLGSDLAAKFNVEGKPRPEFLESLAMMRDGLFYELGFRIPPVEIRTSHDDGPPGTYTYHIHETPVVTGTARIDRILVNDIVERLRLLGVEGEPTTNPANGNEASWITKADEKRATDAGLTTWDAMGYIVLHLSAVVRKNCAELVGVDAIAAMLDEPLVRLTGVGERVRSAPGGLARLTGVLRALVAEEVSISVFRPICEEYLRLNAEECPPLELVENLRVSEAIRPHLRKNESGVPLYELDKKFLDQMSIGVNQSGGGRVLALEPSPCQEMLKAVRDEVSSLPPTARNPVVVVDDWKLRPFVRLLVELEFPHLWVLARRELINPEASPILAHIGSD